MSTANTNGALPQPDQACSLAGLPGTIRELDAADVPGPLRMSVSSSSRGSRSFPFQLPLDVLERV